MNTVILVIAACVLPPDPHWAVGSWAIGHWGGTMLRPDGFVTEVDADGRLIDVGRWVQLDDDAVEILMTSTPQQMLTLERHALGYTFTRNYGFGGSTTQEFKSYAHRPENYDALSIELPPPEPVLNFPEDWR